MPYQKMVSDECFLGEPTYNGYLHFQLVMDEASRYVWGFLLKRKEEASDVVMKHLEWILARGHRVEAFGSDGGGELISNRFRAFLRTHGIAFAKTNSYSPEENGLVERMHGVVLARVRSLLTMVGLPNLLWGEAFHFAVEILNVSPSAALEGETPYTRRFGDHPDVSDLRTWGCLVYAFTPKVLRKNKLENPGQPCLFLGYGKESKSYRVLDLKTGKIKELRTVEFAENWTVEHDYVEKLLLNQYKRAKHKLPSRIPFVRLSDLTSPSPARRPLGEPEHDKSDEHRDTRHCNDDIRDRTRTVVDAPIAVSAPALASAPAGDTSSVDPIDAAEAVVRSSRARGLREVPQSEDSDGDSGAEGGVNLPNRSCSAPREGGGELTYRSGSASARCTLDLSDSDDVDIDSGDDAIASSEPVEGVPQSVGAGTEDESEENEGPGASFRRSTRIRRSNVRLRDYMIDIPASLVIQSVNELLEPTSVEEALAAPDEGMGQSFGHIISRADTQPCVGASRAT